jgi:uncharacterized protein YbjT (DUF2867 family)
MSQKFYVVVGATGQVGRVVVEELLDKGHQVFAIGRNPAKLEDLKAKGAEICHVQNFENQDLLAECFQGAEAVFAMLPPAMREEDYAANQNAVGEALLGAVTSSEIKYVVYLSSLGAQHSAGTGPIKGLHLQEERFNAKNGLNVLHLRAGYFMENFLWSIPTILETGMLKTAIQPGLSLPMVCTEDIGIKAAELLSRLDFRDHTIFEFVGPSSLNMIEATKILGASIYKNDLRYEQLSYEEAKREMLSSGMHEPTANLMVELYRAFNDRLCQPEQELTDEHQGKITFDQFAKKTFAPHYDNFQKVKA